MLSRARALLLSYAAATAGAVGAFGASALSLGLPAVFLALFADGVGRPGSSVLYPTVTHGPRDGQRVALSFDDGPDPAVTPYVLDALARHGARATFFSVGRLVEADGPRLKGTSLVCCRHEAYRDSNAPSSVGCRRRNSQRGEVLPRSAQALS